MDGTMNTLATIGQVDTPMQYADQPKTNETHTGLISNCRSWLGIKNDYRTLVGVDEIDIVFKDDNNIYVASRTVPRFCI